MNNKDIPMDLKKEIRALAQKKNAVILAHNYQNPEIQDIADITGDSLELSQKAAATDAEIIVFCGVHFMAESASILSPEKKVLLPDPNAGCPMAEMAEVTDLIKMKASHPRAKVVTYINSSAAIKAHSDVICTSSNARKIVERIDADEIIFLPDRNLCNYISRFTAKKMICWEGFCPTHERFTKEDLLAVKAKHPDAYVMLHPECNPEVIDMADAVYSTGEMVRFAVATKEKKIIVGTEVGMIHKLKGVAPHVDFISASDSFICPNMKKINLEKLYTSMVQEQTVIKIGRASGRERVWTTV
jgi:quinolinate synthase